MTFDLDPGELANALQFLANGRRTGRLNIHVADDDRSGDLYFRDGHLYFVKYRRWEGAEALARLLSKQELQATFTDGEARQDANIENQHVDSLLVRSIVRADQLADSGEDADADSAGTDGFFARPRARRWLRITQRVALAGIRVVAVSLVFCTSYVLTTFAYNAYQNYSVRRMQEAESRESAARLREISDRREERIVKLLRSGNRAFEASEYELAHHCAEQILALDGNHAAAAELKIRTEQALALVAMAPVKGRAQTRIDAVQRTEAHPALAKAKENAMSLFQSAVTLFEAREYDRAADEYDRAAQAADVFLQQHTLQQRAARMRDAAQTARRTADDHDAASAARPVWRSAEGLETAAAEAFVNGRFTDALAGWEAAAQHYRNAATVADASRLMQHAKSHYQELLKTIPVDVLEQYGGEPWTEAAHLAAEAEQAVAREAMAVASRLWNQARERLAEAVETARLRKNAADFHGLLEQAHRLAAGQQWNEAVELYRQALDVPGFEENDEARDALRGARRGQALALAREASRQEDWAQVLQAAESALALDPECPDARLLAEQAGDRLIPRLTVHAEINGQPVADARVIVNDRAGHGVPSPATFELELNRTYTIQVSLAPDGNTYYRPFQTLYRVKHQGEQVLTAALAPMPPPVPGDDWTVPGIGIALVSLPTGRFQMGSNTGRADERPVRTVTVSTPFWMAKTEVTNGHYREFLAASTHRQRGGSTDAYLQHFAGRSGMPAENQYPVCYVNWNDAAAFCAWLTQRERDGGRLPDGYVYRLPTEAEWEYAARAGGTHDARRPLDRFAWYAKTSRQQTRPVGTKDSNPWGLHDMLGNVWEWCYDWYARYPEADATDPTGPERGEFRVIRGGGWRNAADLCRETSRNSAAAVDVRPDVGFRVVLAPELAPE